MRLAFISTYFFLTFIANAQTDTYLADLAALKSNIEKTASFKAQIKGDKRSAYDKLYSQLALDTVSNQNSYNYFYKLAQLLFPLRDNHLGFYQLPNYSHFRTKGSIDSFITTKEFTHYPTVTLNIDSLKAVLATKPVESVEGIYHYDQFYTVGVFKRADHEYMGVVVNTTVNLWAKGQVAIHLYESAPNLYKAIYGHPAYKYFLLQPGEKYQNQSLVNSFFYGSYSQKVYSKQLHQIDYVNLPNSASKFALRDINADVQYLLIQTFQNRPATAAASQRFYDSIKPLLKAPHLILDLRNNEGGAEGQMRKYLRLLADYVENGQVYVLVNNGTLSQAEIFTLALKRLKNVTIVGLQTKGMLAYGSNEGKTARLPSGRFAFYPTDMDGGPTRLQYEDYGITPDVTLSSDVDWIKQVVEITRKK